MLLTVAIAVTAAVAFGWSTALMHHSASAAPQELRNPLALLGHLVAQWRWLLGMVASLLGFGLHALALRLGSIALVQPLVVTALIFSFIFRAALDRQLPSRDILTWGTVTAVGLALFLTTASSTRTSPHPDELAAALMLVGGVALAGLAWAGSLRARPRRAGLLLGASAGVVFGLIAGVLKAATTAAGDGSQLITSWPLYTLLALGAAGFFLNQRAYHKAPLSWSLPVLNTVNPLVAVAFGIAAFNERPDEHLLALLTEAVGLAAVLAGIFFLGRKDEVIAQAA